MAEEGGVGNGSLFRSMKLTLDSAELALLMSALRLDPTPFIEHSPLADLDGAVMARNVSKARRSVIDRQLAYAMPDRGVVPASPVKDLLTRASQAHVNLVSCSANGCGVHDAALDGRGHTVTSTCIHITHDPPSAVVHQRLPGGVHAISVERYLPERLADMAFALTAMADVRTLAHATPFAAPMAVGAPLALLPASSERALLLALSQCNCPDAELRAFVRAACGTQNHGCVSGRNGQRRWLSDGDTLWLFWQPAIGMDFQIQRADALLFKRHVQAVAD